MFILEWSVIVSPGAPLVVINVEIRWRQQRGWERMLALTVTRHEDEYQS